MTVTNIIPNPPFWIKGITGGRSQNTLLPKHSIYQFPRRRRRGTLITFVLTGRNILGARARIAGAITIHKSWCRGCSTLTAFCLTGGNIQGVRARPAVAIVISKPTCCGIKGVTGGCGQGTLIPHHFPIGTLIAFVFSGDKSFGVRAQTAVEKIIPKHTCCGIKGVTAGCSEDTSIPHHFPWIVGMITFLTFQ